MTPTATFAPPTAAASSDPPKPSTPLATSNNPHPTAPAGIAQIADSKAEDQRGGNHQPILLLCASWVAIDPVRA